MTSVRVESFTISLDGYGAGPNQSLDHPLGEGGTELHQWAISTKTFQRAVFGKDGGTTGVDEALGMDVRIGGGASTIRQALSAGLVDEMHIAISPVVLGKGEPLFEGIDLKALGYQCVEHVATDLATHVLLKRQEVK